MKPSQYDLEFSPRYAWYRELRAWALFSCLAIGVAAMAWLFMHIADVLAR